jgi:aminocarboxymuconate-semialdehyde decarboxylase
LSITIDCDSHYMPRDAFDDVDPRFEHRRPAVHFDAAGRSGISYPDREAQQSYFQRHVLLNGFQMVHRGPDFWDPEGRIEFLDRAGIDMQVLVPGNECFHYDVEIDLATSVCQSYNNAIARLLEKHPGRFIGLAHLPMHSPPRAIKELDRAITELGLHAPIVMTNIDGRNLDEREYWPVYERIEALGVPLILHGSRSGKLLGLERLTKFHLDNVLGFLYEGTLALTSLICGGVLDLFPRLRVGLLETGAGYVPHLMERLTEAYEMEGVRELIAKPPHEYLSQLWLSCNVATERASLNHIFQCYPSWNGLMMATDFPHGLGGAGEACVQNVVQNPDLTEAQKERILGLNAAALFGINPASRVGASGAAVAAGRA